MSVIGPVQFHYHEAENVCVEVINQSQFISLNFNCVGVAYLKSNTVFCYFVRPVPATQWYDFCRLWQAAGWNHAPQLNRIRNHCSAPRQKFCVAHRRQPISRRKHHLLEMPSKIPQSLCGIIIYLFTPYGSTVSVFNGVIMNRPTAIQKLPHA